ncbi:hypothetical protein K3X13_12195 [Aliiroseovarius crassostreae]|uniref:Uncharacterized protein n=1 Tax=Aliiroseovarius crassostreae TaxID=154981 RepID=A0A9Q9H8N7_9RHOB|nr:hypothetical protein [Aliiroseovarius crassostreae]UWP88640.1 hypothetical protein K3J57_12200 [Aliiroseovarius crassostreae]UWP91800.1 hypothetical protein K3X13_12195 [Aliiroseovarius crassostreae]UWP94948.1 hypothetical protein K3X48_12175 [Aliiroseovarius crassostreae]UWQ01293.1 hypothetical protein K3X44_12485 [Aliiroseovarius crassostreae]
MMITSITISGVTFDEADQKLNASVVLTLGTSETEITTRAQFLCRTDIGPDQPRDHQLLSLAREALRQARRLPDCVDLAENTAFHPQNITLVA